MAGSGWFGGLLCLLLLAGCAGESRMPSGPWHQRYEPVDAPAVLEYVDKCFAEAKRLFGSPLVPVREVHVRWSQARQEPYRLCRADITDWAALARVLMDPVTPGERHVAGLLVPGLRKVLPLTARNMNWQAQLMVVADLNRIIRDARFLKELGSAVVALPEDLRQQVKKASISPDFRQRMRAGRKVLTHLFPGLVLPVPRRKSMGTGFSLCECTDQERGIFIIYIDARPKTADFYLKLGHESAHLLNANMYDWYVEGLNTAFSRHMARMSGKTWQPFADLFARGGNRDPYAVSFFMMERVWGIAGKDVQNLFDFAVPSNHAGRMEIDIDGWLRSMKVGKRRRVIDCISKYAGALSKHAGRLNQFNLPAELSMQR